MFVEQDSTMLLIDDQTKIVFKAVTVYVSSQRIR